MFTWGVLCSSALLLIATPFLAVALTGLLMDRVLGVGFFDAGAGGDPVLYEHLFWFFGHPEVYILIFPAFGIVTEILSHFSARQVFGKSTMVFSMISIGFLGLWV